MLVYNYIRLANVLMRQIFIMTNIGNDSLKTRKTLKLKSGEYDYFSLAACAKEIGFDLKKLPYSLKILLENLLRHEDGKSVTTDNIKAFAKWIEDKKGGEEIAYRPARVLMQDFTGVPAVVDLAAMRDAVASLGGDPKKINPLAQVDLVIDHSVQVDEYGTDEAFEKNVELEMERNAERYELLRSAQKMFDNFNVVPPGTGICHQVNLEFLAKVVWNTENDGKNIAYPDTLVGTDSHTTMINGLAVLGWGVGGIEAESAMLGQPISMTIPEVIGFEITGKMQEGITATDVVLKVTQMLREKGVVGKFVEFYGEGLDYLTLADRATVANMAPEYGATCGFFPVDSKTMDYLKLSNRSKETIELVEAYAKEQGLWREDKENKPVYTDSLSLDLADVVASLAGPKRPQDRVDLKDIKSNYLSVMEKEGVKDVEKRFKVKNADYDLGHADIVIAAITSCTNTSNPSVMIAAGLVAKKAIEKGLSVKPWVKTSLAPGSKVVTEYLEATGLQDSLNDIGFDLVGYGCTTCIGNSGPLQKDIDDSIRKNDIAVTSVLSGNRNFEGRVHQLTKGNYLGSPPLVVAYAIAGTLLKDITTEALGQDKNGKDVFLKDIWPTNKEISDLVATKVTSQMFKERYADVFNGDEKWQKIPFSDSVTYQWSEKSTYIKHPPFFDGMKKELDKQSNIEGANILALLGDSITTDHISPAGAIAKDTPAAKYLMDKGVEKKDFNSYGSRRGNDDVMTRGTFANIRIRNELAKGTEGGFTTHIPSNKVMSIFEASELYKDSKTPLVVIGGKDYGMGSSRDWAAKGTLLLGVKAVIAESFERIHRSNLVGMGVLPLTFKKGVTRKTLKLYGTETLSISGLEAGISPKCDLDCTINYADGKKEEIKLLCRIDTADEIEYYKNGGILHNVVRLSAK